MCAWRKNTVTLLLFIVRLPYDEWELLLSEASRAGGFELGQGFMMAVVKCVNFVLCRCEFCCE